MVSTQVILQYQKGNLVLGTDLFIHTLYFYKSEICKNIHELWVMTYWNQTRVCGIPEKLLSKISEVTHVQLQIWGEMSTVSATIESISIN